jgi:hypothetical protein
MKGSMEGQAYHLHPDRLRCGMEVMGVVLMKGSIGR